MRVASGDLGDRQLWPVKRQEGRKEETNLPGHHHLRPCRPLLLRHHARQNGVCSVNTNTPCSAAGQRNPGPLGCLPEGTRFMDARLCGERDPREPSSGTPRASSIAQLTPAQLCLQAPQWLQSASFRGLKHLFLLLANLPAFLVFSRKTLARCRRDEASSKASGLSERGWPPLLHPRCDAAQRSCHPPQNELSSPCILSSTRDPKTRIASDRPPRQHNLVAFWLCLLAVPARSRHLAVEKSDGRWGGDPGLAGNPSPFGF